MGTFLRARWVNLALVTYRVPGELLEWRLPTGCELDRRDGEAFVSLVAFDFVATQVLGVGWPGFRNFPEINLRFYVRRGEQRGVCFVREFVPSRVVAALAKGIYNEPYRAARMKSWTEETEAEITVRHELWVGAKRHCVEVCGAKPAFRPGVESAEHFFKEHQWGFGRGRDGGLVRYEVVHPEWNIYPVQKVALDWDWAAVYGAEWSILQEAKPYSVVLAAGSVVAVYPKKRG